MTRVQRQLARKGKSLSDTQLDAIKKEVIEGLISQELLYQESQNRHIRVEESAVNEQWETLKKRFPDEARFKSALDSMNLSEAALKAQIKRGLAIQHLINQQFIQKTAVSREEVKKYYDTHPALFQQPEQVKASHILIKVGPQADGSEKAAAHKKIETIRQKLRDGADFASLAREFSEGPSGPRGGDLGFFRRGQMVKPFEDAAFALTPGGVSDIVETKFGYHLIKTIEKKPETILKYEKISDRLHKYLKDKKVQQRVDEHVQGLKANATIERFSTETSN
jgi:peptidyl-prolyl cis-trans isomerase C